MGGIHIYSVRPKGLDLFQFTRRTKSAESIQFACFRHLGFHFVFLAANMRYVALMWMIVPEVILFLSFMFDAA